MIWIVPGYRIVFVMMKRAVEWHTDTWRERRINWEVLGFRTAFVIIFIVKFAINCQLQFVSEKPRAQR
jgi:hypothetical protein